MLTWEKLDAAGIPVLAIRDTPRFEQMIPECLLAHADDQHACGRSVSEVYTRRSPLAAVELPSNVVTLDLSRGFCDEFCEPIIGNVVAYHDDDHISATYARSLAPALREALEEQAPWLF